MKDIQARVGAIPPALTLQSQIPRSKQPGERPVEEVRKKMRRDGQELRWKYQTAFTQDIAKE